MPVSRAETRDSNPRRLTRAQEARSRSTAARSSRIRPGSVTPGGSIGQSRDICRDSQNPLLRPFDQTRHTGIMSIQIPSAPIAPPIVWPKRRGDNPSKIRSPTIVPMRTPTVATMMGAQSVSRTGPECQR